MVLPILLQSLNCVQWEFTHIYVLKSIDHLFYSTYHLTKLCSALIWWSESGLTAKYKDALKYLCIVNSSGVTHILNMRSLNSLKLALPLLACLSPVVAGSNTVVDLGYAIYQGTFNSTLNRTDFLALRYAAPPTGSLWFSKEPWK